MGEGQDEGDETHGEAITDFVLCHSAEAAMTMVACGAIESPSPQSSPIRERKKYVTAFVETST